LGKTFLITRPFTSNLGKTSLPAVAPPLHCLTGQYEILVPLIKPRQTTYCSFDSTPRETPVGPILEDAYQDPRARPFAVFEFRYRTMDGLVKEGIVRTPTISDRVRNMSEQERVRALQELLEEREVCNSDV